MTRTEESRMVKKALRQRGIKARVWHGQGTGWGYLHVEVARASLEMVAFRTALAVSEHKAEKILVGC